MLGSATHILDLRWITFSDEDATKARPCLRNRFALSGNNIGLLRYGRRLASAMAERLEYFKIKRIQGRINENETVRNNSIFVPACLFKRYGTASGWLEDGWHR